MSRFDELLDTVIDTAEGDFVAAVEAEKLIAAAQEKEPSALDEWLHLNAVGFATQALSQRIRHQRVSAQRNPEMRKFQAAIDAHERGDDECISHFVTRYEIDDAHTRRRVADMTGADHNYVADRYNVTGKQALLLESFHRAIAKKVGKRRTADAINEDQYDALFRSIVTRSAP